MINFKSIKSILFAFKYNAGANSDSYYLLPVTSGIPQAVAVGSVLFMIYTNTTGLLRWSRLYEIMPSFLAFSHF